jgi:RNA polymerase sigma factor (sigma-70 family)
MKNGALSHVPVPQGRTPALYLDGETDRQLLERFVRNCDGDAFATLVKRYGPMVLGACRRVLSNAEEAEDAFQATFLVLVRKARSIAQPELLGNWLYGVAYRIARKARARCARLAQQERPLAPMSPSDPVLEAAWRELHARLDEELQRLPAKYRAPLVLCYLEGLSNKEAANRLGWPVGSISYRLARGREMLKDRLRGRHPDVPPALMAALPIWGVVPADALARLQGLVVKLGNALSRGGEAVAAVSPTAQAMADGALKAMAAEQKKYTLMLTLLAVVLLLVLVPVAWAGWSVFGPGADPASGSPLSVKPPPMPCHADEQPPSGDPDVAPGT